jgi:EpsI family protein
MRSRMRLLGSVARGLFVPMVLILALQAVASRELSIPERDLPLPALHSLPTELGTWKSAGENSLESNVAEYLKPDEYILRDYVNSAAGGSINVFVAYFKSLQNTLGPHSPRVCLPGSGWLVRSSKIERIPIPQRAEGIPVNKYILEKGDARIFVIYWYQNDRTVWAEEFQAKLKLLPDLIRYRRSDVSLVRLVTPIRNPSGEDELTQCVEFTKLIFPTLVERFGATR